MRTARRAVVAPRCHRRGRRRGRLPSLLDTSRTSRGSRPVRRCRGGARSRRNHRLPRTPTRPRRKSGSALRGAPRVASGRAARPEDETRRSRSVTNRRRSVDDDRMATCAASVDGPRWTKGHQTVRLIRATGHDVEPQRGAQRWSYMCERLKSVMAVFRSYVPGNSEMSDSSMSIVPEPEIDSGINPTSRAGIRDLRSAEAVDPKRPPRAAARSVRPRT